MAKRHVLAMTSRGTELAGSIASTETARAYWIGPDGEVALPPRVLA
jgi:hypothetical protein